MKNFFKKISLLLVAICGIFSMSSCKAPKDLVGRYDLSSVTGYPGLSVSNFEFYYIDLKSNYDFTMESRAKGGAATVTLEGTWKEYDTYIKIFYTQAEMNYYEELQYDAETKSLSQETAMEGYTVNIVFTKAAPTDTSNSQEDIENSESQEVL